MKKIIATIMSLCIVGGALPAVYSGAPECTLIASAEATTYQGMFYEIKDGEIYISGCTNELLSEVVIPSEIDGIPVTGIGSWAFLRCNNLKEITIPDSVTSIGLFAFNETPWLDAKREESPLVVVNGILIDGLTCSGAVTIPDSVKSIGVGAFESCTNLTEITLPDSVTSIGNLAFSHCTSLTEITIPDSVASIGDCAFSECTSLTEITIPDSITSIGYGAFGGCKNLTEITIPDSVTSIEQGTFADCKSLTGIIIPDSVTSIADFAFADCTSLTEITIPNSLTYIEDNAFNGCDNLTIKGCTGSYAETYANENNIPFVPLGESPTSGNELKKGDANGDNDINMSDVVIVMQASLNPKKYGVNGTSEDRITADGEKAGDVDGKEGLSANDALIIQKFSLGLSDTL